MYISLSDAEAKTVFTKSIASASASGVTASWNKQGFEIIYMA